MQTSITERAHGRWRDILSAVGVPEKALQNRHGPCPVCGGKDRFRWDNKQGSGSFFCSSCGAGNGIKLVMLVKATDYRGAALEIEKHLGSARRTEGPIEMSSAQKLAKIKRKWTSAVPVECGSPVRKYLLRRGLPMPVPKVIRSGADRPEMVTIMQAPDGRGIMCHLTLLTEDGSKAPAEKTKLFMLGTIPPGSAVRLAPIAEDGTLGIAEGIETALSATMLDGTPCWAALNEGMLGRWEPPEGVTRVVIYGDNDLNFVGQSAAYALARKLSVRKNPIPCEVKIPNHAGTDWNDVLCSM